MVLVDNQGNLSLNLDLGDVDSIDRYAVAVVVRASHRLHQRGGELVVEWWPDNRVASEGHLIGAQGRLLRSRYSARSRPGSPAEGSGSDDLEERS
jgi:hypothetical protein